MKRDDRYGWNSTLKRLSPKKEAELQKGKHRARSTIKKPTLEEMKKRGIVVKASSLNAVGKNERSTALDDADTNFSTWIRVKAADEDGLLYCFICGNRFHWKEAVAMHCEPRASMPTRFDQINVQPGCTECNGKPNGDRETFRTMLDMTFGKGTAERNIMKSKTTEKFTAAFLRHLSDKFLERINKIRRAEPSKFIER